MTPHYPATSGPAVDEPASLPQVTGVGGTTFNEGSGIYWNNSNNSLGGSATSYIRKLGGTIRTSKWLGGYRRWSEYL